MDGPDADDGFDYPALMRGALVDVVRRVLARVAEQGLPGEHQLYLTFATGQEGVELPAGLRRQFPVEMTIVLQHQFWSLAVDDAGFGVTLRFAGRPERLVVPWAALHGFADPSVDFGFRLRPAPEEPAADEQAPAGAPEAAPGAQQQPQPKQPAGRGDEPGAAAAEGEKVVDFGAFRRRSEK